MEIVSDLPFDSIDLPFPRRLLELGTVNRINVSTSGLWKEYFDRSTPVETAQGVGCVLSVAGV